MHDPGAPLWLLAAAACAFAGMGWLALAMPAHALQAWGRLPAVRQLKVLCGLGASALLLALACCLRSDHASMAVLVWTMLLGAAAVTIAMVLASRPGCLRVLVPWMRERAFTAR